jgi:Sulfotransferase family
MSETAIYPVQPSCDPREILLRANALFRVEQSMDLRSVIAAKIEDLQHYDLQAMDRVAAILCWGRSGSLLLSSYLDGHADVMMLPEIGSQSLYYFFECYKFLPLRDKLIAYPVFEPHNRRFFEGDFAISPAQYYAAVQAILEFYADWPAEFRESRRAFFLFVHIAYNLALGRRPAGSHPLIVFAQHMPDDALAKQLVEDFPLAKFVHVVRDPISSCNGMFRFIFSLSDESRRACTLAPFWALFLLTNTDQPHSGMESRTRTLRFEDLHSDTAETVHDLADWLGLPFQATLLDSTFNGVPWIVKRDGIAWSGRRSEHVQRQSQSLSLKDQALLFAFLYENFVEWNYPCPKIFRHPMVRCLVFFSLLALPTKMEIIAARGVFTGWTLPSLRQGNVWPAIKSLLGIGYYRLKIMRLVTPVFVRRLLHRTTLLHVGHRKRPEQPFTEGARTARSAT